MSAASDYVIDSGLSMEDLKEQLARFQDGQYSRVRDIPPELDAAFVQQLGGTPSATERAGVAVDTQEPSGAASPMLEAALQYARAGFDVFPVRPDDKTPGIAGWQKCATRDEQQLRDWWLVQPNANVGIRCNKHDGRPLMVVDVDPKNGGENSWAALTTEHGAPTATRIHCTPSGGLHFFFHPDTPQRNSAGKVAPGIDIRATGGYVVAPPSTVNGKPYTVESGEEIADAPSWLIEAANGSTSETVQPVQDMPAQIDAEAAMSRARDWLSHWAPAIQGQGGDARTYQTICRLRDFGVPLDQMLETLEEWNARCEPPWDESDLMRKVENAFSYAQNEPGCDNLDAMFQRVQLPESDAASEAATVSPDGNTLPAVFRRVRPLGEIKPGPELWQGVLPERAVFAIGALPGRSKSYAAAGLSYALASDAGEFLGRALPKGLAAVYIDAERLSATELRIAQWCQQDGIDAAALPLVLGSGLRIDNPICVDALIEELRAIRGDLGRDIGLVVVDSLGASLPGAELNSSGPATKTGEMLRKIRDELRCAVGVVAHSPKSGVETVAGSLHFDAIFDTTLFMRSENLGENGVLYVKKSNALIVEERERFIPWAAETCTAEVEGRSVRVHRLVSRRNALDLEHDEVHALRIIGDLAGDQKQAGRRAVLNALRGAGIVAEGDVGRVEAARLYERLKEKRFIDYDTSTIVVLERGALVAFDGFEDVSAEGDV